MCVIRHLERLLQVGQSCPRIAPEQVRVAQCPQRLGVLGRRAAPLEALDGAPLNGDRPVEEAEPRIADPGIVQRRRVHGHVGEIGERQHALEQGQRLIEPAPYQLTGAQLVQRERLVISIFRLGRSQRDLIEALLRVVPSAELKEHLSLKSPDVELKTPVVGSRRQGVVRERQRLLQLPLGQLHSRAEKQLAAAQRVQSGVRAGSRPPAMALAAGNSRFAMSTSALSRRNSHGHRRL